MKSTFARRSTRFWVGVLLIVPRFALAHDVSVDVGAGLTATSEANPRVGNASASLAASVDLSDAVTLFGSGQYTRDFGTRTADVSSPGSDVFHFGLGVMVLPARQWMATLSANGSPPAIQRNVTSVTAPGTQVTTGVVVLSRAWNLGGLLGLTWASAGFSRWEHLIDLTLGATSYNVFQRLEFANSAREQSVRALCDAQVRRTPLCSLVNGAPSPLFQARLSLAYTAVLANDSDAGLEGAWFFYDKNPSNVGYFSLYALGQVELGSGVPLLPLQLSVRPTFTHRFERVSVKVSYQFGLYPLGEGSNHALTAKLTWKFASSWRVWLTVTGQVDATQGMVGLPAGNAVLGGLFEY